MDNGNFVISLDFELYWGVRDKKTLSQYGENIKGVHKVIPRLLNYFDAYQISATFSTVGLLFFETKEELMKNIPHPIPEYSNSNFSPYTGDFELVGKNHTEDLYHFAPSLIEEIKKRPQQEIGSHTFSHYYCLESGQTLETFTADMKMAIDVANKKGIKITSIVFPRNQYNDNYLKACSDLGVMCYRGNEFSWLYEPKNGEQESKLRRGLRLLDAYFNLSGHNCYNKKTLKNKYPINIPASRFLRPYNPTLKMLDYLKLHRIKTGMTYAAKNNLIYHLWWHPHNFGINQDKNFSFLEKILEHYKNLNVRYNFNSNTMSELALQILNEK